MTPPSRRDFLRAALAAPLAAAADPRKPNVHDQLLAVAAQHQERHRARFAAVKTKPELNALRRELRDALVRLLVEPRGVGALRPGLKVKGHPFADPLCGVEENLAYNAFLVGRSLLGMRVTDVHAAVKQPRAAKPGRVVLVARADAALVACLAAAVGPEIDAVAVEGLPFSLRPLFDPAGRAVNAASILPNLLRDFGDVADVLAKVAPRRVLVAEGIGPRPPGPNAVEVAPRGFTAGPAGLLEWLRE